MASVILSSAGAAIGSGIPVVGPLIGGTLGRVLGSSVGGTIDNAIFGVASKTQDGARLSDLNVQVSTYGKMIPIVYGSVRIAGNVIWSRPIKETVTSSTTSSGGGKGGGGTRTTTNHYSYTVSLAIGLCEGEITEVVRAWADAQLLDMSQGSWRLYKGTQDQLPDSYIESFEGVGKTPAYRGLAYVVLEDFPLAEYGNRIPNFTFEVKRKARGAEYQGKSAEEFVTSVVLIPGAGEFVYDTQVQYHIAGMQAGTSWAATGDKEAVNRHTPFDKANMLVSLDQMQETLPNVEWVSVVVSWFGTHLDAAACTIHAGVEYHTGGITQPDTWSVGGVNRASAYAITHEGDSPRYGGTPSDASVVRLLTELRSRGLKVMLYPMFFMDVAGKPWRGRVTGSASDVATFFTKTQGYNAFIEHYAHLCAVLVDGFIIGSELVGLTKVSSSAGVYPAVNQLVSLAANVRGILGADVTLTYAADWSEYHHTDGGWYHMDTLWASPNIDVIGIDAYFPLTNASQSALGYDVDAVREGWVSGEGADYYYTDEARTTTVALSPAYAWKKLEWFWDNTHTNPNGSVTAWTPRAKKIWFTEYGFPSVDGATNQPNVFYDPHSSESAFPRFSGGRVDFRAQRVGILATEAQWADSACVERRFLWTWDARPYPYYPDLSAVWADSAAWVTGHWVTGKFGMSSLAAIVQALCVRAGLDVERIDVTRLTGNVEGYVLTRQASVRSMLEELMQAYRFDALESDGVLRFIPRGGTVAATIPMSQLVRPEGDAVLQLTREQAQQLPDAVHVIYLSRDRLYQYNTQSSYRAADLSQDSLTLTLPLVMTDAEAYSLAEMTLAQLWQERQGLRFWLHREYAHLEVTDTLRLEGEGIAHTVRITAIMQDKGLMRVDAVTQDASVYDVNLSAPTTAATSAVTLASVRADIGDTQCVLLNLPLLPAQQANPSRLVCYAAAKGQSAGWKGAALYRSDDGGANYLRVLEMPVAATMGSLISISPLASGADGACGNVIDRRTRIIVALHRDDALESITELGLLNGGNFALLGAEIIQFQTAQEFSVGVWEISGLLRGRLGSHTAIASHVAGEDFIVLDARVQPLEMDDALLGLPRHYKAVSIGRTLGSAQAFTFTTTGESLRPYAPVHGQIVRDTITGDAVISWIRSTRAGAQWRDYVDAALAQSQETYVVEIINGAGDVVHMAQAHTPSYTYTHTQQLADFGALPSVLTARIAQLSESVGRGSICEIVG
jgi:hypothetical protein